MAIRSKLTERDPNGTGSGSGSDNRGRPQHSEEERAARKERVQRAKDALKRSAELKGDHVASARKALKAYLQKLNEPRQPTDDQFDAMVEAPFRQPPPKRQERGFGGRG